MSAVCWIALVQGGLVVSWESVKMVNVFAVLLFFHKHSDSLGWRSIPCPMELILLFPLLREAAALAGLAMVLPERRSQ